MLQFSPLKQTRERLHLASMVKMPWETLRAFSLVEVTLAIGIVSFSLLAILGLMPVGLTTMRQAMDSTIETQIVRQISAEMLLTPFSQLGDAVNKPPRCFDDEGQLQSAETANTRYWATLSLANPVFPGSANATVLSNSLSAVRVVVVRGPAAAVRRDTNYYSLSVPNSGN